jgi:hypothetical protein
MTNYTAVSGTDIVDPTKTVWYVTFADGARVGTRASLTGYKNEESAKRRIRDLKRKEAEESAITGREAQPVPTATPEVAKLAETAATSIAPPALPDAAKLAAQHSPYGTTPAGVYPAISKRERRRQWNYA